MRKSITSGNPSELDWKAVRAMKKSHSRLRLSTGIMNAYRGTNVAARKLDSNSRSVNVGASVYIVSHETVTLSREIMKLSKSLSTDSRNNNVINDMIESTLNITVYYI